VIKLIVILLIGYSTQAATILGGAGANRFVVSGGGPTTAPTFVAKINNTGTGNPTIIATITVGAEANKIMLVSVGQGNTGGTPKAISSVQWSGNGTPQNLTAITGGSANDGNFCSVATYYLVNPTAQVDGTVTATFATSPAIECIQVCYYSGAAQTSMFGTAVTGSSTSTATATVTVTSGTGQMVWGAVNNGCEWGNYDWRNVFSNEPR
jgi:hypothetical protein